VVEFRTVGIMADVAPQGHFNSDSRLRSFLESLSNLSVISSANINSTNISSTNVESTKLESTTISSR